MSNRGKAWIAGAILLAACGSGFWFLGRASLTGRAEIAPVITHAGIPIVGIGCYGKVEPDGGVLLVTAPYFESRPSLVSELRAKNGDWVQQDQVLAILDSKPQLEAAVQRAAAGVSLAQQRLAQVRAGAKPADIGALRAERARLQDSLQNAETEYQRYSGLLPSGAVSKSAADEKALAVADKRHGVEQIDQRITALTEVRDVDVNVAESEVDAAVTDLKRVQAQLESAVVKAPFAGRVLSIHARKGEEIGPNGLLDLARTQKMYVVAEVYETDAARVHAGQRATAKSDVLPRPLQGTVERIDHQVSESAIEPVDPLAFAEHRVVKAYIRLVDTAAAEAFVHGKVEVVIEP